mmetsp:Transcript_6894/g.15717  ORF Transcript_6894/g.15717 Transcript_6894/m.15717 type:complete len:289 (-) Transcript_6894:63-929(-)|eukprot:CAMPEP_0206428272 /NCGR_PEP_ID=MMETSP0324_2-20121206/5550_1 /ASSEMBLY_ACC=CAM_ASM_000836 /TAXON_ID=2866 /ORGANISM="Crypthecodinium cohnii, Strain Seligo" /LENGTH=288 /DNA_ID=CAMNT_0053893737 /DNA_START=88 /DNA_END=951 /DNA_ORIENTATION=+
MGNVLAFVPPNYDVEYYDSTLKARQGFLELTTSEGERIPAFHVRCTEYGWRSEHIPRFTIIYSHGNAEDIGEREHLDYIEALACHIGADIFSYEYVGYSLSKLEGKTPSEDGCIRSIEAAWIYCTEELNIPSEQIVLYGLSIGSGPTVDLASRAKVEGSSQSPHDCAGVVLQSPIESGARAALGYYSSVAFYGLDIFRNYEKAGNIEAPVAILHGRDDTTVPVGNGMALYTMVKKPHPPLWLDGYGHNDLPTSICFEYVGRFIGILAANAFADVLASPDRACMGASLT